MLKHVFLFCLALLWLPAHAAQEGEPDAPGPAVSGAAGDIGYPSPAAALAAMRSKPGAKTKESEDWIFITDSAERTVWIFTKPGNPAHPAASRNQVIRQDGSLYVRSTMMCGASKAACDDLYGLIEELNRDAGSSR